METKLLVIGALVAITAMGFILPATTAPVYAVCAGGGKAVACAGNGAFARAGDAVALAFKGFAAAFIR
jgi:hypothetical protein